MLGQPKSVQVSRDERIPSLSLSLSLSLSRVEKKKKGVGPWLKEQAHESSSQAESLPMQMLD